MRAIFPRHFLSEVTRSQIQQQRSLDGVQKKLLPYPKLLKKKMVSLDSSGNFSKSTEIQACIEVEVREFIKILSFPIAGQLIKGQAKAYANTEACA